ncbi:MAG: TIR domain-containing protein [Limisphaerales bacterium]
MIVLHHSGGASDFSIVGVGPSPEDFKNLSYNALRLLRSREQNAAAKMIESIPFEPLEATNHFGDGFSILHASLSLVKYEKLRLEHEQPECRASFSQIASAFEELGVYFRFIVVDLQLESDPVNGVAGLNDDPNRRLTRLETNKLVNRYIGVTGGYLGDFTYRTHHDFYLELELDIDPYNYDGTTRERFIKILSENTADAQARILDGILKRYPVGSSDLRTQERRDEIATWIARLKGIAFPRPSSPVQTRSVDPQAVLTAKSQLPAESNSGTGNHATLGFRFDFGISFARPERELARQLRDGLRNAGFEVFFDEDYEHEMIGYDGSLYLRNVYSKECRFCIVLISQAYDKRDWTNMEREAVQARELRGERGILIPVPIEDYQPPWLPETRIRFDLWKRSIPELVTLLTKRCGQPAPRSGAPNSTAKSAEVCENPKEVILTTKKEMPQWADHLELNLGCGRLEVVTCKIATQSPYFRFGFKLFSENGRLFGDGSIQSQDTNLLAHIGRNDWNRPSSPDSEKDIFFTWYNNGISTEEDKRLFTSDTRFTALLELRIDSGNIMEFRINGLCCLRRVIPPEICRRVVVLAWGDRNPYAVEVREITVTTAPAF